MQEIKLLITGYSKKTLSPAEIDEYCSELREALLEDETLEFIDVELQKEENPYA